MISGSFHLNSLPDGVSLTVANISISNVAIAFTDSAKKEKVVPFSGSLNY
ncbi:MAG TPA: hypothetical protein V6C71_21870 [Coleofasciculaceae cyanobacterium]